MNTHFSTSRNFHLKEFQLWFLSSWLSFACCWINRTIKYSGIILFYVWCILLNVFFRFLHVLLVYLWRIHLCYWVLLYHISDHHFVRLRYVPNFIGKRLFPKGFFAILLSDWHIPIAIKFRLPHNLVSTCYCQSFFILSILVSIGMVFHCDLNLHFPDD